MSTNYGPTEYNPVTGQMVYTPTAPVDPQKYAAFVQYMNGRQALGSTHLPPEVYRAQLGITEQEEQDMAGLWNASRVLSDPTLRGDYDVSKMATTTKTPILSNISQSAVTNRTPSTTPVSDAAASRTVASRPTTTLAQALQSQNSAVNMQATPSPAIAGTPTGQQPSRLSSALTSQRPVASNTRAVAGTLPTSSMPPNVSTYTPAATGGRGIAATGELNSLSDILKADKYKQRSSGYGI